MFKRNENDQYFDTKQSSSLSEEKKADSSIELRPSTRQSAAAIGPSIIMRGDITGEEDLMIQGRVEGTLQLPQNDLTVGPNGKVKAELRALNIEVEGEVFGDLHGTEKVVVRRSGRVEGNISSPRVVLEDGCRFKGAIDMDVPAEQMRSNSLPVKKTVKSQDSKTSVTAVMDDTAPVAHAAGSS